MTQVINWLNLNSYRRYPLTDDSSYDLHHYYISGISTHTFANDVLLDFKFVSFTLSNYKVILDSFDITSATNTFRLKFTTYDEDTQTSALVWIEVQGNSAWPCTVFKSAIDQYSITATFGPGVTALMGLADGEYRFTGVATILPTLLSSQYKYRVNSVAGSSADSIQLVEDIFLEEGANIAVSTDKLNNIIYLSAYPGAGKGVSCEVLEYARNPGKVVKTVNGLSLSPDGNINIVAGPGVDISTSGHTVIIRSKLDKGQITTNE